MSRLARAYSRRDADAREVLLMAPDIGVDGHLVVVEDDDELRAKVAGVVERLERLAARHVADDGDDLESRARAMPRAAEMEVLHGRRRRYNRAPTSVARSATSPCAVS